MDNFFIYIIYAIVWFALGFLISELLRNGNNPPQSLQTNQSLYFQCVGTERRNIAELTGSCGVNCQIDVTNMCKKINNIPQ